MLSLALRGNVRTGQVFSETRSVKLKGNAACRRVCVSAALCYTERLVSQQQTARGGKKEERKKRERKREHETFDRMHSADIK